MKNRYHFIGIGGVGMSALAHIALQRGDEVSGSDVKKGHATLTLAKKGAKIVIGHFADSVEPGQIVIYNSMIDYKNPELKRARDLGLKIIHRSDLLEEFLKMKQEIIIAGSHGKTTTTALLSHVLAHAKEDPSYVVGGFSPSLEDNGKWGSGPLFVAEGDESDGSFLKTNPHGAIVTNIDFDHLSYWKTNEKLIEGFKAFIDQVQTPELLIYNGDDPYLREMVKKETSFGFSKECDFFASNIIYKDNKMVFDVGNRGKVYKNVECLLIGNHNVRNALGVFAMATMLGIEEIKIREALVLFRGVQRRLEFKGEIRGVTIFDDYAHHPNEIKATYKTLKEMQGERRLVIVFQPHRFSRTQELFSEFVEVLSDIEGLILTDIFPAGEAEIEGITAKNLSEKVANSTYVPKSELLTTLSKHLRPTDLLVTMGAGDITEMGLKVWEQ